MSRNDADLRTQLQDAYRREGDPALLVFERYLRWKGPPAHLIRVAPAPEDAGRLVSRHFAVLAYPQNPLFTTYGTLGGSMRVIPHSPRSFADRRGVRYEYLMHAPPEREREVCDLLALIAEHPHRHTLEIGPGYVLPVGEPVVPRSSMEYLYLTYPYLDDPRMFEGTPQGQIERPDALIQWLWVLPIYRSEFHYIRNAGPQAFEELLQRRHSEVYDAYDFLRLPVV
ncbi:MAG TPA: suppressor of fused domain protein [Roseiflexaceae bacterium]|nr:suppressor of fused domain protein [Roseiflexaceae bacterium]